MGFTQLTDEVKRKRYLYLQWITSSGTLKVLYSHPRNHN